MLKRNKRVVWIGIFWCLASLLVGVSVGKLTKDLNYQALHSEASDRILASIHRVRGALNAFNYLPFLLTQNQDIIQLVGAAEPVTQTELADKVSRYLEQTNLVAGASGLFLVNQKGQTVAYSNWRDQQSDSPKEFSQHPIFQLAEHGEEGRFYENTPQQHAYYYLSAPIYKQTHFVGAAIVRIDLERLLPDVPPDELFAVSDDSQSVFMSSQVQWIDQPLSKIAFTQESKLHSGTTIKIWTLDKQHYIVQKVRLDDLGWTFTSLVSAKSSERYANMLALICIAVLWILGVILLFLRERRLKHHSQQETRAAIARSEEQQRSIIKNSEVGLITLDQMGNIRFLNDRAAQQFNLPFERCINQPLLNFIDPSAQLEPLLHTLNTLGQRHFSPLSGFESMAKRSQKPSFPILISLREMHREPEYEYLATVIDISRRKQLEQALLDANESLEHKVQERTQALKNAQDELIQTSKMAALGRMSTAIVHELNQPLTAMRTYIAICRQLLSDPDMIKENLQLLDDLTQRMAVITSQLKTFAYKKPEQVKPVNVQNALSQTLILLRKRIESTDIKLSLAQVQAEHTVMGDNVRLEQVFVNLLNNAYDALVDTAQGQIQVSTQIAANGLLVIRVEDNGPGIADDAKDALFEPFFTTKPMGSGLGLGLSIVRAIILDLGGTLQVTRSSLGGASFEITLPNATLQNSEED